MLGAAACVALNKIVAIYRRIFLTDAGVIRLWKVAGSSDAPPSASDRPAAPGRVKPLPAVARFEPTVTQPSFDTIEEHVGTVFRYALRVARRPDLAEELAQETMLLG
jgi:hypothetical protein